MFRSFLAEACKPNSQCKGCGNYPGPDEPWKQHAPVYDDVDGGKVLVGKEPKGRICYHCNLTFALAGWSHQYGAIVEYFKFAATPKGRSKHQDFFYRSAKHVSTAWQRKRLPALKSVETAGGKICNLSSMVPRPCLCATATADVSRAEAIATLCQQTCGTRLRPGHGTRQKLLRRTLATAPRGVVGWLEAAQASGGR